MLQVFKKIFNNSLGIILAYIILALFFTFPLILNITGDIATGRNRIENPTDNQYLIDSDSIYFMWNLWFFKNNLFDLKVNPLGPSDMIFYPQSFNVAATGYDNLFNSFLSLPLQLASNNLILIYNILVIFNFVFAACSAYLLAYYLTGDKKISFLSGIIFGFSPYMIARSLAHFSLMTSGAIPLFILFFIKMIREKKYTNAVLSAISLFLVSISSWQYGLFAILFVILSLVFFAIYQRSIVFSKEFGKKFILFTFFAIALITPVVLPAARSYANQEMAPYSPSETLIYSASLLSFLTPSPFSTFIGRFIDPEFFKSYSTNIVEGTAYLGFLEFFMIILCIQNRKKIALMGKYWLFLIATFFILSLGSFLKLSLLFGLYFDRLLLPYYFIFKYVPFFNLAREAIRLDVFIMIFAAVIFALTLKHIFSQSNAAMHKQKIILLFFTVILIAERMILPYPAENIRVPSFYRQIANEKENYAILDLPINSRTGLSFALYNYYQTIHGKKITSGKIMPNAFSAETNSFIERKYLLRTGTCLAEASAEERSGSEKINKETLIKEFRDIKIKYVIVHKDILDYMNSNTVADSRNIIFNCGTLEKNIQELFNNTDPVFEDELIKVYDITKTT